MTAKTAAACRIELFGSLRLIHPDGTITSHFKRQAAGLLLAYLALFPGRNHSREHLIELLWPNMAPDDGRANLNTILSTLRKALGSAHAALVADRHFLKLDFEHISTDVAEFDSLVKQACSSARVFERARLLEQAVVLYRGDLLKDRYEDWALAVRGSYKARCLEALIDWAQDLETQHEWKGAQRAAERALAIDELQEDAVQVLMRVYSHQGQKAGVIRTYERYAEQLLKELNTEPAPNLRQLQERLLRALDAEDAPIQVTAPTQAPEAITSTEASIRGSVQLSASSVEPTESPATSSNLPLQINAFLGRRQEIEEIRSLLTGRRLLTLTGMGGCGKTRLALQIGSEMTGQYKEGVWLVELAAFSDPVLVAMATARTLRVKEQSGRKIQETLVESLQDRQMLLILDNCEHLVMACAELAELLVRSCPHVTVLATSREALAIQGEQTYRVPSLAVPPLDKGEFGQASSSTHGGAGGMAPENLLDYDSVRLFVERAKAANPHFSVTPQNVFSLASVCHRLDGLPLAIELAAARIRAMSLDQIETRLDNLFQLLTGGSRTAHPRQQTLKAVIDWSYDLLNTQEKALLGRLSVFAGGWTLETAAEVCSGDGVEDREALDLLTSLVDKSLVVFEELEGKARYRFLETVRQYARDRLFESGEVGFWRTRHRDCFLALVEETTQKLQGPEQGEWIQRLEEELANLRAAMDCSLNETGSSAKLRFGGALGAFWGRTGRMSEGLSFCCRALENVSEHERTSERANVLHVMGVLAYYQGENASALAYHTESLDIRREIGNQIDIASSLGNLGTVALAQGDYDSARSYGEEALVLYREMGKWRGIAFSLSHLGNLSRSRGDYASARNYYQESLDIRMANKDWGDAAKSLIGLGNLAISQGDYVSAQNSYQDGLDIARDLGDKLTVAIAFANLGNLARYRGDYASARNYYEDCLDIARHIGSQSEVAGALVSLGDVARRQSNYTLARDYYREALTVRRRIGEWNSIPNSLEAFVGLAVTEEQYERAAMLIGAVEAIRHKIDSPLPDDEYDSDVAAVTQALAQNALETALTKGRAMTEVQAMKYALEETQA